jgi:hypothetical protein
MYVKCFDDIFKDSNPKYREKLIVKHKQLIQSISQASKKEFSIAINEAGLID